MLTPNRLSGQCRFRIDVDKPLPDLCVERTSGRRGRIFYETKWTE
jgi:hypothetical protein